MTFESIHTVTMKTIAAVVLICFYMLSYPNVDLHVDGHINPLRARHPPVYGTPRNNPHGLVETEARRYERTPQLSSAADDHLFKPPSHVASPAEQTLNVAKSFAQDAHTSPDPSPEPSGGGVVFAFTLAEEGELDLNIQLTFRKFSSKPSTAMINPSSTVGPGSFLVTSQPSPYYVGQHRWSRIGASPPSRSALRQTEVKPTAYGWSNRRIAGEL